jgi:Zn finger protein HypA/HybF involved in hydrogenase expression
VKKTRTFYSKRDLRGQLRGHFLEGDAESTIRDVSATACCERCGGKLDISTLPMSDRLVEECPRCGTSEPVQRFAPMEEHKDVEPPIS